MPFIRTLRYAIPVALVSVVIASNVLAASSRGQPLILDTQKGISDGQSGTILQTAPLSHARIVEAQPIATPPELSPNSPPILVSPYIEYPAGGPSQTAPRSRLRAPAPVSPQ